MRIRKRFAREQKIKEKGRVLELNVYRIDRIHVWFEHETCSFELGIRSVFKPNTCWREKEHEEGIKPKH